MYSDFSPEPNSLANRVLVVVGDDPHYHTIDEIVNEAREVDATYEDGEGDEIFCIVFANEPHRVEKFTERTLRQELERRFSAFGDVREVDGISHAADDE